MLWPSMAAALTLLPRDMVRWVLALEEGNWGVIVTRIVTGVLDVT